MDETQAVQKATESFPQLLPWITAAWVLITNVGRLVQAVKSGGGLVGMWNALLYGTNVPTEKQQAQTKTQLCVKPSSE